MKGLESPLKKRARLSLKKRDPTSETSPRSSSLSSSWSPASNSTLNSTNSIAAFNNVNTASPTSPSTAIITCVTSSSCSLTTTSSTTSSAVASLVAADPETPRKINSPRDKDADNSFELEANNDVISINSDDVYESMPIVAALENLDNTCFLNSVLQILRYTPKFIHGLNELCYKVSNAKKNGAKPVNISLRSDTEDGNVSCQVWEMTVAIAEMFKQMSALERKMQGSSNVLSSNIALKPEKIQQVVRKLNSMFEGSAQHDAQEFLQFILYHLQEAEKQMKKCTQEARRENGINGTTNKSPDHTKISSPSKTSSSTRPNSNNNCSTTSTTNVTTSTNNTMTMSTTSNNTASVTNETFSLPSTLAESSNPIDNSNHESCMASIEASDSNSNSIQNPTFDPPSSTKSPPENSDAQIINDSVNNHTNSNTHPVIQSPENDMATNPTTSSPENNSLSNNPHINHNGNHVAETNGDISDKVSNFDSINDHYLNGTVVNGDTDKLNIPGGAIKAKRCILGDAINTDQFTLGGHVKVEQRTPSPQKASSNHTSSCLTPLLPKLDVTLSKNDNSVSLGLLTNGMSKTQVKQIKNAVVKLEKCDVVCNSPQKSVNAYYAIECLGTGKTLNGKKKDFVEQLFLGTILSRTRCLECEKASEKLEEFLEVSVPLKKSAANHSKNSDGEGSDIESEEDSSDRNTLISFISSFSEVEKLQGDNKYYCDSCCNYVEADRSLHYETLPDILTVHLKRFSASSELGLMCKINDHVDVPLSLPCLLYKCNKNCCRIDHRYTLFGIITHAGYTISSGHYVAYVKTSATALTWHFPANGQRDGETFNLDSYSPGSDMQQDDDVFWLECDDSSVRVFTEEDFLERLSSEGLLTGTPYLLFYHKSPMSRSL